MAKKKTYDIIIDNKPNSDMSPKERRLMELINGAEPKDEAEKQIVKEINNGSWRSMEDYENIINTTTNEIQNSCCIYEIQDILHKNLNYFLNFESYNRFFKIFYPLLRLHNFYIKDAIIIAEKLDKKHKKDFYQWKIGDNYKE